MDLKVTDWFQLVIGSTSSITSLADISVISWNFFKPFTAKIGLINTYKMLPCLLSNLIRALRYLSPYIQIIGILATWLTNENCPHYILYMHAW